MGGGEKINSKGPAVPTHCHVPRKTVQAGKGFTLPGPELHEMFISSSPGAHRGPGVQGRCGAGQGPRAGLRRDGARHPRPAQACSVPSRDCVSRVRGHLAGGAGRAGGARTKAQAGENWHVPGLQGLGGLGVPDKGSGGPRSLGSILWRSQASGVQWDPEPGLSLPKGTPGPKRKALLERPCAHPPDGAPVTLLGRRMPQARAGREPPGESMGRSLALGPLPASAPAAAPATATTALATGIRRSGHHEEQDDRNDVHPLRANRTGERSNRQTNTETERG